MRVPLRPGNYPDAALRISDIFIPTSWQFSVDSPKDAISVWYVYEQLPGDEHKFFENGFIYNADDSLADNKLQDMEMFFYGMRHSSLSTLLSQPDVSSYNNYLYGLPVGNYDNLERIASVRDRLNVPDWVALLVVAGILDEGSICAMLIEIPDLFTTYSLEWVLRVLCVSADDVKVFSEFDENGTRHNSGYLEKCFEIFCKAVEVDRQHSFSSLKFGGV